MAERITVVLADDHDLVRRGFRRLLEDEPGIEVVGEAGTGLEAIELVRQLRPRVVVMDIAMPGIGGVEATREILKIAPETAVLVLSMHAQESYVRSAFEAGARGYLLKNAREVDLPRAVRDAAANRTILGVGALSPPELGTSPEERLTPRERQVLQLIAEGKSNKEIAHLLGLSVNTVAVHRANIMQALGLHRTAELVVYAISKGLVHLP